MRARRAGAAGGAVPARAGERHADRDDGESVCDRRLPVRAAGRQRALRYGAVADRRHAGLRPAACRCCCNRAVRRLCVPTATPLNIVRHANPGDRTMSQLDYPFHFDTRGRTAEAAEDAHIRDLIEQVLFTAPGERVNRPDLRLRLDAARLRAEQRRAWPPRLAVPGSRRTAAVARRSDRRRVGPGGKRRRDSAGGDPVLVRRTPGAPNAPSSARGGLGA